MSGSVWYLSVSRKKIEFKKYPKKKKRQPVFNKKGNKIKGLLINILFFSTIILFSSLISAAEINDTFHINVQTTFSNGTIQSGTFAFAFNITESSNSSCLGPIVYNHSTSQATDTRGIVSIYLPTIGSGGGNLSSLSFDKQYYLCYYRDGTLKDVSQLGRVPYSFRATQVNLSEVSIDSNLTLGSFNVSASSGFFTFLGSLASRISKIFATDADISNNLVVGRNLTVSNGTLFVNNNTGRVGINTISPAEALDIIGTIQATGPFQTTGNEIIYAGSPLGQVKFFRPSTTNDIALYAGGLERVRINGSQGNVGINITNPQNILHVFGDANITGATYLLNSKCASGEVLTANTTTGLVSCVTDQTGAGSFDLNITSEDGSGVITDAEIFNITGNGTANIRTYMIGNDLVIEGTAGGGGITGSGTSGFIARFNGTTSINNSLIFENGSSIGVNTTIPGTAALNVSGLIFGSNGLTISAGTVSLPAGEIGAFEIAASAINTTHILDATIGAVDISANSINTTHIIDGQVGNIDLANSSLTVTAGNGLTGGGSVALGGSTTLSVNFGDNFLGWTNLTNYPTGCGTGFAVQVINDTLTCVQINSTAGVGNISGAGTANNITKWTGTSTIGNSIIYDTGSVIGIGTTTPDSAARLEVIGLSIFAGNAGYTTSNATRIGNDIYLADIDTANTLGLQGAQNPHLASIKLGSGGGTISGSGDSIGIGTTSPTEKLSVQGTIITNDSVRGTKLTTDGAGSGNRAYLALDIDQADGIATGGDYFLIMRDGNDAFISNSGSGDIFFQTDSANNRTVIKGSTGFVGINTVTPQQTLNVIGDGNFTGKLYFGELATNVLSLIEPIYIRGTGLNNNGNRVLKISNTTIYDTTGRGLRLTILWKANHTTVSDTTYDTYGDSVASNNLAAALNGMTNAQMGTLTSNDAWENNVTANLDTAFGRKGLYKAQVSPNSGSRRPYAAIFESASNNETSDKAEECLLDDTGNQSFCEIRGFLIDGSFDATGTSKNSLTNTQGNLLAVVVDENANVGIGTTTPTGGILNVVGATNITGNLRFGSLQPSSINATYIAGSSINTTHILDNTIAAIDIASSAINTTHILDNTITAADIASSSINTTHILDATIGAIDIAASAINTTHILDATIGAIDIAASAINTTHILDNTILTIDLSSDVNTSLDTRYLNDDGDTATGNYTFDTSTFFIDSTNDRVGIGTTTPGEKLEVNGNIKSTSADQKILGQNTNQFIQLQTSDGDINFASIGDITFNIDSDDNSAAHTFTISKDATDESGPELFRVQENGNVGIGTTSPIAKLHVNGSGDFPQLRVNNEVNTYNESGIRFRDFNATGGVSMHADIFINATGSETGSMGFRVPFTDERLTILSTGNVGINDATPDFKLDVEGNVSLNGKFGPETGLSDGVTRGFWLWSITDSNHVIYSAASTGTSPAGANASDGIWDAGHRMRFRTATGQGFLFENNAETALVDIDSDNGNIRTIGDIDIDGGDLLDGGANFFSTSGCGANTGVSTVGSDGLITCVADTGTGTMSSWLLAASGTAGTESITDGETVTFTAGTGISSTRSTNTITITNTGDTNSGDDVLDGTAGDWEIASSTNSTPYTTASIELREATFGGSTFTPPRLSFHWGGVVASQIAIESNGRIAIRDNPGTGYENLVASDITASGGNIIWGSTDISTADIGIVDDGVIALITETSGNFVGDVAAGAAITVTGTPGEGYTETVAITADAVGDTQLAFNTGQTLTTAGTPQFARLGLGAAADGTYLLNLNGALVHGTSTGVGIGTTTPTGGKLNIVGGNLNMSKNNITGVTKITFETGGGTDPPYRVGDTVYSTYGPFMVGAKEEVTGIVQLNSSYVIDFTKLEIGSDLWLFNQVTDFGKNWENLQVILTPGFDGRVWYTKNPANKTLTIYGTQAGEVSYRLTGNGFTWGNRSNIAIDLNPEAYPDMAGRVKVW